jgi:hypothetical protein
MYKNELPNHTTVVSTFMKNEERFKYRKTSKMLHLCNSVHMRGTLYICHFLTRPNKASKVSLESEMKTILFTSTFTRRTQRICYHLKETRQHIQHKVVLLCTQVDKHVTGVQVLPPPRPSFFL